MNITCDARRFAISHPRDKHGDRAAAGWPETQRECNTGCKRIGGKNTGMFPTGVVTGKRVYPG